MNFTESSEGTINRLKFYGNFYLIVYNLGEIDKAKEIEKVYLLCKNQAKKMGYDTSKYPETLGELTK